mgnify:CR=1 FL=1
MNSVARFIVASTTARSGCAAASAGVHAASVPTTGSIQKRLKRQGSKFASAEAFRVYKFTDGAWSDIILGAVMGAARRVEHAVARQFDGLA